MGGAGVVSGVGAMGTTALKAIETHYAGCRFRSRLEARWAVFFDALGIEWRYEPEGFEVNHSEGPASRYLPDFHLPRLGVWVEVKGDLGTIVGDPNLPMLHCIDWESTPISDGLIILSDVPDVTNVSYVTHPLLYCRKGVVASRCAFDNRNHLVRDVVTNPSWWSYPQTVEKLDLRTIQTERVTISPSERWGSAYIAMPDPLADAYRKARTARFEHGETPTPPPRHTGARPADAARAELARRRSPQSA